jgi:hypothetical protein
MSTEVTKVVLRSAMAQFKTPHEAYAFFTPWLGKPQWKDRDDRHKVTAFGYGSLAWFQDNPTQAIDFMRPCYDAQGTWGVEFVLAIWNQDRNRVIGFQPSVLSGHAIDITKALNAMWDAGFNPWFYPPKLYSYTWYNGVDEPVRFD